jgi:hypothetical protein
VDRAVLAFLKSEALHPADFTIREDGVVRLNPEFGAAGGGRRHFVLILSRSVLSFAGRRMTSL